MTGYDAWKTRSPDDDCQDEYPPVEDTGCDCCGADNVPLMRYRAPDAPERETQWLCAECLADAQEPLDPMRGVEFPFAENH